MAVATDIAANPIPSLIATKELMLASGRLDLAKESHAREVEAYKGLVGAPRPTAKPSRRFSSDVRRTLVRCRGRRTS